MTNVGSRKIVVTGGTGLIGSKVVRNLGEQGYEVVAAVKVIADSATEGNTARVPPVRFQPLAPEDVARGVSEVAMASPLNEMVELGGPEQFRFDDFIRRGLIAYNDPREVVADPHARYFGTELAEYSLVPETNALLGKMRFAEWLSSSTQSAQATSAASKGTTAR